MKLNVIERTLMLQMIITRLSEGLRSSSWVWSIQVDRPGTHETVPDRFRLIPDHLLRKIQIFVKNFGQKVVWDEPESIGSGLMSSGPVYLYRVRPG